MERGAAGLQGKAASWFWRPAGGMRARLEYGARRTATAFWRDGAVFLVLPANLAARDRAAVIDRLLWGYLGRVFAPALRVWADSLNAEFFDGTLSGVAYHRQYRRWGSCSARGRVYLSHRLLVAPEEVARPVLLHELAHLGCLDHSRRFWSRLAAADPLCRTRQRELALYGQAWSSWWEPRQRSLLRSGEVCLRPMADWRPANG